MIPNLILLSLLKPLLAIALSGPATCSFAIPADMHPGTPEWLGPCAANRAEGVGVLRVAQPGGKTELFYGRFHAGLPVRGIFGTSDGNISTPTHAFSPRTNHSVDDNDTSHPAGQDATLWTLAAEASRTAAAHYDALGNKSSADFYRARAKVFSQGPGE